MPVSDKKVFTNFRAAPGFELVVERLIDCRLLLDLFD